MSRASAGTAIVLLLGQVPTAAQSFELAGVRALGFGGAFVAVADDASAVWWNPAGLASGPFFNAVIERQQRRREPAADAARLDRPAVDQSLTGFALTALPLGISYFRTRTTVLAAAAGGSGREPSRASTGDVASLIAHQAGVTLLHSLTPGIVVGSTLKFVRGIAATLPAGGLTASGDVSRLPTGEALDRAADLVGKASNRFDADLGVHFTSGPLRAGLTVRNIAEPSFESPGGQELALERQARVGVAWMLRNALTIAADLDLLEQEEDPAGRRIAVGIEQRWAQRVAVRGGLRMNTSGGADASLALGGSYAVRGGMWVDGFWSRGEHEDTRWGVAGRVTY